MSSRPRARWRSPRQPTRGPRPTRTAPLHRPGPPAPRDPTASRCVSLREATCPEHPDAFGGQPEPLLLFWWVWSGPSPQAAAPSPVLPAGSAFAYEVEFTSRVAGHEAVWRFNTTYNYVRELAAPISRRPGDQPHRPAPVVKSCGQAVLGDRSSRSSAPVCGSITAVCKCREAIASASWSRRHTRASDPAAAVGRATATPPALTSRLWPWLEPRFRSRPAPGGAGRGWHQQGRRRSWSGRARARGRARRVGAVGVLHHAVLAGGPSPESTL